MINLLHIYLFNSKFTIYIGYEKDKHLKSEATINLSFGYVIIYQYHKYCVFPMGFEKMTYIV